MSDSEETIWDPISSLGRVMPPSDFVIESYCSSFSQTKKKWPERLLPRPSTPQTLTHNVEFIFLRTSPLKEDTAKRKEAHSFSMAIYRVESVETERNTSLQLLKRDEKRRNNPCKSKV